MSRAINLNAPMETVTALCGQHGIGISTIEPLQSGGTRLVLRNSQDADQIRRRMKGKLIDGTVVRSGMYIARKPEPFS